VGLSGGRLEGCTSRRGPLSLTSGAADSPLLVISRVKQPRYFALTMRSCRVLGALPSTCFLPGQGAFMDMK
jgi:hypothetical protein